MLRIVRLFSDKNSNGSKPITKIVTRRIKNSFALDRGNTRVHSKSMASGIGNLYNAKIIFNMQTANLVKSNGFHVPFFWLSYMYEKRVLLRGGLENGNNQPLCECGCSVIRNLTFPMTITLT